MPEEDIIQSVDQDYAASVATITYRLTINEDFTSLVEFGSYAPDTLPTTYTVASAVVSEDGEVTVSETTEDVDSEVTTAAEAFVVSSHIKLPNFEYLVNDGNCIRFQDNETVEAFVSGNINEIKKYASNDIAAEPPYPEQVAVASQIERMNRNVRLMECDWTQGADSPLSAEDKAAWATYRTALRNLSDHANWPRLLPEDWPTKP